jgi:hypothetical protein
MLNAKELEKVEIKTASFPKLLNRAGKFFDLAGSRSHLSTLHNIRNELVHHRGTVDIADVNLLLIERIFPFLEQFTKGDPSLKLRLKPEMWKRLKQLAESSADVVTTEIAKRIGHFAERAEELSSKRVGLLLDASPEIVNDEKIVEEGLLCPACSNRSLIAFSGWEVETDETGRPYAGWPYSVMRCKVCGLILDPDEILLVLDHFDRFLGKGQEEEKKKWEQAIEEPDNSDYRE